MIQVTINGHSYSFPPDTTILNACEQKNIYIPTLCYHNDLPPSGKCGLCVVKINGNSYAHACIQKITKGMQIETNSPDVIDHARRSYNNFIDMSVPPPSKDIEEITKYLFPKNTIRTRESDQSNSLLFDPKLCINCGRCVRMCSDVQNINALNYKNPQIRNNECISCGQCITVCPTNSLREVNSKPSVLSAMAEGKTLILQIAPAARVSIGESFGFDPGTVVTAKIIQAARKMGFKYVFDTSFGADMTVIEEGNELLRRMKIEVDTKGTQNVKKITNTNSLTGAIITPISSGPLTMKGRSQTGSLQKQILRKTINFSSSTCTTNLSLPSKNRFSLNGSSFKKFNTSYDNFFNTQSSIDSQQQQQQQQGEVHESSCLPQFTSCCPAWVNYVEKLHHELIPHLSSTKSPHMIVGVLVKTYFASIMNIDPNDIFLVSLMPCVAKKDEIKRMQMKGTVDAVLTSREFISMINDFGIDFKSLNESEFDSLLGDSSGSGQIFGTTGGVAEATVRYIHKLITHNALKSDIEYEQFRGMKTIKTASINIGDDVKIRIAVCNGIAAVNELIENELYKKFDFIEVMACPGGCIGGAGQPYLKKSLLVDRMKSIFSIDRSNSRRIADENKDVELVYNSYVGPVGSSKAFDLFHTHFEPQETAILAQKRRMMSKPVVCYGSASGTAMKFARIVAKFIGTNSIAMNNLKIKHMITRKVAIFIVSTIGDGEFPTNAKKFVDELSKSMDLLSDVKFAVCALGNKSYKYFCRAGVTLDELLEQHLAKQLVPLTKIDTSTEDKGEADFENWCHLLSSSLGLKPPKIEVHLSYSLVKVDDDTVISNPLKPVGFDVATLKSKVQLTPDELNSTNHQMNSYLVKLPKGFSYSVGDVLEILPENPTELVEKTIEALKLNPNEVFLLISNDKTIETYIPEKVSVRQLFSQFLDLNGPPTRSIIRAFLLVANKEGSDRLSEMLEVKPKDEVKRYMKDVNTCEFICEFAKYGIPSVDLILSSCHHIKARQYLISSSPMRNRNIARILVLNHKFGVDNKRNGICTSFLERPKLRSIPIRIVKSSFEMPEDGKAPIIMVAVGCGIAPMLSIIQSRGPQNGPSLLIFGSTSQKVHHSISEEIENEKKNGGLTDVLFAWSNENIIDDVNLLKTGSSHEIEKTTCNEIKDIIMKNKSLIWKYWFDDMCSLYYCGIPGSLPDEIKELFLKITIQEGGLSMEEAMAINNRHQIFLEAF